MQLKSESYNVWYNEATKTINFSGSLRLSEMEEYAAILQLLNSIADTYPTNINLDLQHLEFLNSSGINMLSKFVIEIRKRQTIKIMIVGSNMIPWQGKSLKNLQRLMPGLVLQLQ
jgi:hypothetical protein